ncbi:TIGR03667 family PPOX class F420-dependent oxidoreductase [Jiangella aurantiaca]|uniref:TIGR03667 family PPOX class F420-dependent oxidoreductase n=1 Tax=Jiangella aurantiaca TaxID=2530373 RepID=A0A4R5A6Q1_9ACTN|nr:TIGR03667 family PPOX class F420-dependent oxidoreductase [Jiangella aurantiaca]TDD66294.1 TIGR03667 family PPOX class F420-dependent oxidoreductase [Jiangella aurantiaca]
MTDNGVFPSTDTPFGRRVHERLRDDRVLWLTVVAPSGTPQPNPVWFVRVGDDIVVYNDRHAARLDWLDERPRVALHLNSDPDGGDVVVLTGRAELREDIPPAHESPEYVAKYGPDMVRVSGSAEEFVRQYSVAAVIRIDHIRGY